MDMIFEENLRGYSFRNRVLPHHCAERAQMPLHNMILFALFFGPAIFLNKRLIAAVMASINALHPAQQNLDAFLTCIT